MATLQERKQKQHEKLLATAMRAAVANSKELKALRAAAKACRDWQNLQEVAAEIERVLAEETERIAREDLKQMSLSEQE